MKYFLSLSIILLSKIVLCQNLVFNGGFEILKKCPDKFENLDLAVGWYSVYSIGNHPAQIRNLCSDINFFNQAIPRVRQPRNGNGYLLILAGQLPATQTKLLQKLKKDKQYKVEFYLQSNPESKCALTPIFGLLSKSSNYDSIVKYENINSQVSLDDYHELLDTANWVKVDGIYTAKGDEKYFTLAYLNIYNKPFCLCIYSIDDISVTPLIKEDSIPQIKTRIDSLNLKTGDIFTLKNVNFDFDKSELLPESYTTLNELLNYLKENIGVIISINGHTDNIGTEEHNIELSRERAKTVYDYLNERGISMERMTFEGFGSSKPLNDNLTEGNRKINRRVEIKIERKN
ncbi:MAG: OmpA family protein [Tenuifilaceae bacterium]